MSGKPDDEGWTGEEVTQSNSTDHSRRPLIEGTIVRYDDKPDECTLHPAEPTPREYTTRWITAEEGSYVSVTSWR